MACSATNPPLEGNQFIPGQGKDQGKISIRSQQTPAKKKNTNVRVIFMDPQFETPSSSRSNTPNSEEDFTTLFFSKKGGLNAFPSFSPSSSSSSALCLLHSGSLPVSGSWMGPTSGPLASPTTGLENPPPCFVFPPPLSNSIASPVSLSSPPENLNRIEFVEDLNVHEKMGQTEERAEEQNDLTEATALLDQRGRTGCREEEKDDLTEEAVFLKCEGLDDFAEDTAGAVCRKPGGPTGTSPVPSLLLSSIDDPIPPLNAL